MSDLAKALASLLDLEEADVNSKLLENEIEDIDDLEAYVDSVGEAVTEED